MYFLSTPLDTVKGIGPKLSQVFAERELYTVRDLLVFVPLRYEDRSLKKRIAELVVNELVTVEGEVTASSNFYKGRRSIQSATIKDETGRLKLMWFNNPHVISRLVKGEKFLVSGKLTDRGVMIQPTIERLSDDAIHTGRLVPVYSMIPGVPPATFRRILKNVVDHLTVPEDELSGLKSVGTTGETTPLMTLADAIHHLHFPDSDDHVVQARERFALEELLTLIQHSQELREKWKQLGKAEVVAESVSSAAEQALQQLGVTLPFTLTGAQQRCVSEVLSDLHSTVPMNRLLIGDVGSGKTAVAGVACSAIVAAGHAAVLVAPTQILAEQHWQTFQKLFPGLPVELVTSKTVKSFEPRAEPTVYIGTHAVLNRVAVIHPALVIYDEQHRFGVGQRSVAQQLKRPPHILTLSATPIPRTLMLTLFSHLQLSVIDELPPGRQEIKTWLVPEKKRGSAYDWIAKELKEHSHQALIVCPFIDPSESEALENVAAATATYEEVQQAFNGTGMHVALLHGRVPKAQQKEITEQLYQRKIDVLVTTPIVEVGVDLPAASVIIIEAAERFGLASLHQLRGRVGRAGQQAYCLLFTTSKSQDAHQRLQKFCDIHDGLKLAEMDLQRRGAGDLFGSQQHGFDDLQFASWTNLTLITQAKLLAEQIEKQKLHWTPFIALKRRSDDEIPLAN